MQKIFNNGKIYTLNIAQPDAEAIFINDENIVLTGTNSEINAIKNSQTKCNDLSQNIVLPAFYDTSLNLNKIISCKSKTAKNLNNNGKLMLKQIDLKQNCTFLEFKTAFLKQQKLFIENGITSVWIEDVNQNQFSHLVKLSENSLLKIDYTVYVNILENKGIMDNNCRSFRKYKNHLRIGGYMINLDGDITSGKAWLSKPYKHLLNSIGINYLVDENLIFVIKTALEEKKQLIVKASGDRAVEQFLSCYSQAISQLSDVKDNYKILLRSSGIITNKQLKYLKQKNIGLMLDLTDFIFNYDLSKKLIGKVRLKKALNFNRYYSQNIDILLPILNNNFIFTANLFLNKQFSNKDVIKLLNTKKVSEYNILNSLIYLPAKYSFEIEQKGSLEVGKKANFVILNKQNFVNKNYLISNVYNYAKGILKK